MRGIELYSFLSHSSTVSDDYLLVMSELPDQLHIFNKHFQIMIKDPVSGIFGEQNFTSFNMILLSSAVKQAVQNSLRVLLPFMETHFQ